MSDGGHTPHPGVCVCRLCVPSVLREFDREKLGCHFDAPPTGFVRWGCERVLRWRSRRLSGRSCAVLKSTADLQSGHPRGLIAAPKIAVFCGMSFRMRPGRVGFTFKTHRPLKPQIWSLAHEITAIKKSKLHDSFSKGIYIVSFFMKFSPPPTKIIEKTRPTKIPSQQKTTTPHHRRPLHLPLRSCYKNYGQTVKE